LKLEPETKKSKIKRMIFAGCEEYVCGVWFHGGNCKLRESI